MSVTDDRQLRALERAATTSDVDRLLYARALERLGRRDQALEALLPGRADPEIRRMFTKDYLKHIE